MLIQKSIKLYANLILRYVTQSTKCLKLNLNSFKVCSISLFEIRFNWCTKGGRKLLICNVYRSRSLTFFIYFTLLLLSYSQQKQLKTIKMNKKLLFEYFSVIYFQMLLKSFMTVLLMLILPWEIIVIYFLKGVLCFDLKPWVKSIYWISILYDCLCSYI